MHSLYSKLVNELSKHPDYKQIHVAKKRTQIAQLLSARNPSLHDKHDKLQKSFWVNTSDYMSGGLAPDSSALDLESSSSCSLYNCFSTALAESKEEHFLDLDTHLICVQTSLGKLVDTLKTEKQSPSDIAFAINKLLGWTSLLLVAKDHWVLVELAWVSEEEIAKEALSCGDDRTVAFSDLLLVS